MKYTIFSSSTKVIPFCEGDHSLDTFATFLEAHQRYDVTHTKDGNAFCPAIFDRLYRRAENVSYITAAVYDFDVEGGIEDLPFEHLWYQTFSSEAHAQRWRLVVPFADALPIKNAAIWANKWWGQIATELGVIKYADRSGKNADRLYYLPRHAIGEPPRTIKHVPGPAFDWTHCVNLSDSMPAGEPQYTLKTQDPARPVTIEDYEAIRTRLKRYALKCPAEKRKAIQAIVRGKMPGTNPKHRAEGQSPRNPLWLEALYAVAVCSPDWVSTEALLHLVRPAWDDEVLQCPQDYTNWGTLVSMLDRARVRAARKHAKDQAIYDTLMNKGAL